MSGTIRTKWIGIILIAAGVIAGVAIAVVDIFDSYPGATTGIIIGVAIMLLFWAFGVPAYRSATRTFKDVETALAEGRRITAVVDAIDKVDDSHKYEQGFVVYWVVKAYGSGRSGPHHEYINSFDDEVTSVRPGDPITIALHQTKPDVHIMLLEEKLK